MSEGCLGGSCAVWLMCSGVWVSGCGAQFKSRYCLADLCQMAEKVLCRTEEQSQEYQVQAHYFASHEGKSDSDTAGSLEKLRAERIMLRNTDLVVTNAAQLVSAIQGSTPPSDSSATAKYTFRVVEDRVSFSPRECGYFPQEIFGIL